MSCLPPILLKLLLNLVKKVHIQQLANTSTYTTAHKAVQVVSITADHTCEDEVERDLLLARSKDPRPIRASDRDIKLFGEAAVKRYNR